MGAMNNEQWSIEQWGLHLLFRLKLQRSEILVKVLAKHGLSAAGATSRRACLFA